MATARPPVVDFGPFHLHVADRKLLFGRDEVRVGGRGMDLLLALAQSPGEVVGKAALMQAAWPDTTVDDSNLKVTIAQLRRALRDRDPAGQFINNVVGRGYWLSAGSHPAGRPRDRPKARVPAVNDLLGRDLEVAQVAALLGGSRLVTIVGPGGIGKTALAARAAHDWSRQTRAAVTSVDLSQVRGEEHVAASIAAALGISAGRDSLQAVYSILARQEMLLVLDTCEHVLQAVAHIADVLLARTERVSILATSREVLRARGEKLLWLSPLAIPPADDFDRVAPVLEFAAPQLLARRAAEAGGRAQIDDEARALVQLCRVVEGSPLAIELVAPRVAALGARAALGELEQGLMALRRRGGAGPARQRTLADTLQWSYSLLSASEAATLRALSAFAGRFSADAAVAVARAVSLEALDVIDALSGLRSKSMLAVEWQNSEPLYRLLDSTREFAERLLDGDDEAARVHAAHARWVLDRLGQSSGQRATLSPAHWRAIHGGLIHDLRKAIDWTLRRSADPMLGIRLVAAGLPLLHELSLNDEIGALCEQALVELRRLGVADAVLELALTVGLASVSTYLATDPGRATALFSDAIRLARRAGDAQAECRVLGAYATFELLQGRSAPVLDALTAMRSAAMRSGMPAARWEEEQLRAQYEIRVRQFDTAFDRVSRLSAAMEREAELAVPTFQIHQRLNVEIQCAALNWLTGRSRDAMRVATQAAEHVRSAEHGLTIVHCLAQGVVWTLFQCGEHDAVLPHIATLRDAIYRHGIASWIPVADTYEAVADAYRGYRPDPARLRSAFYGVRAGLPQIRHDARYALIADAMIANRQPDDAAEVIDHVWATSPDPWCRSELLRLQAAVDAAHGRTAKAIDGLRSARAAAEESGSAAWTLRAATALASFHAEREEGEEARRILLPVVRRFEGEYATLDLRRARALLA